MTRSAKIGISITIGIAVLCGLVFAGGLTAYLLNGGSLTADPAVEDPEQARRMAAKMIDYELPDIFHPEAGFDSSYGKIVVFTGMSGPEDDYGTGIFVAQILDVDLKAVEHFRQEFQQITRPESIHWQHRGDKVIHLRNQEVAISTYEGESGDGGELLRQMTTELFEGKSGLVFISIIGSAEDWPQAEIDAFLASIH